MPLMTFYSLKSLVWNPFLELLVGVFQLFMYTVLTWPEHTVSQNGPSISLKVFIMLTDTLQRLPFFERKHPSWKLVAEQPTFPRQVVAALNGQEEQILTKQRKCNRLRPVWWSCLVMRMRIFRKDGSQCQDGGGMCMICFMEHINCMFKKCKGRILWRDWFQLMFFRWQHYSHR